jgi:hypothetical protein
MTLLQAYHFGGASNESPSDMKTFGSSIIIAGTSFSTGLSHGFEDMFVMSCQVNTA